MPTYLVHGFRWPRPLIRIHIILQNLDDAAAEWLIAPGTTRTMLENFHHNHPEIMKSLPRLRFVEQHDPNDESVKSQPYAYVADVVHEVKLGVEVDEIRGKGVPNEQWTSMLELRDKLCPGEKVAWFVVVCGDEERFVPPSAGTLQRRDSEEDCHARGGKGSDWVRESSDNSGSHWTTAKAEQNGHGKLKRSNSISRGLRKLMGRDKPKDLKDDPDRELKQSRSLRSFRSLTSMRSRDQLRATTTPRELPPRSEYTTPALPGTAR